MHKTTHDTTETAHGRTRAVAVRCHRGYAHVGHQLLAHAFHDLRERSGRHLPSHGHNTRAQVFSPQAFAAVLSHVWEAHPFPTQGCLCLPPNTRAQDTTHLSYRRLWLQWIRRLAMMDRQRTVENGVRHKTGSQVSAAVHHSATGTEQWRHTQQSAKPSSTVGRRTISMPDPGDATLSVSDDVVDAANLEMVGYGILPNSSTSSRSDLSSSQRTDTRSLTTTSY